MAGSHSSDDNQVSDEKADLPTKDQMRKTEPSFGIEVSPEFDQREQKEVSPESKRKLEQFQSGSRLAGASELVTEKSNDHFKRIRRGTSVSSSSHHSRMSGSSLTNDDEYQGKPKCPKLANLDDTTVKADDSVDNLEALLDKCDSQLEIALRLEIQSDDPPSISNSQGQSTVPSNDENKEVKTRNILEMVFSDGKYFRRSVPIGPGFQADVPEWTGPVSSNELHSPDGDLKVAERMGTLMWPIEGKTCGGDTVKAIGKGRPDSCSCISPGSVDCVKHHIHETRHHLQSEIGPAFRNWKFDEMGEYASNSWSSKEQRTFESLLKSNPLSKEENVWKLVFERFPDKCKKSIIRYYYNVFITRRMSLDTKSANYEIDSEED